MEKHTRASRLSLWASLFAVLGILFWRKTDAFTNPQLWAEDGTVFFQQAYSCGFETLWTPYAGYYHLLPRLVAWLATFAPFEIVPAIYNAAALFAMGWVVVMLHSPRLKLPSPYAFSLVLVLVPHFTGEVFMNLTNVQWPLALLLLLTVLQEKPSTWRGACLDALIVVLVGLSTPLVGLTIPILLIRVWRHGGRWLIVTTSLALAVSAVQIMAFLEQPTVLASSPSYRPDAWIELLGWKTFGTLFFGRKWPYQQPPSLLLAAGVVLLGWMAWRLSHLPTGRKMALPALVFGLTACALAFYKFRLAVDLLVPPAAAIRYFYVLWVVVCWGLLVLVLGDSVRVRLATSCLLLVILHSSLTTVFRSPPFQDFAWASYAAALEAKEPVQIPINPPGWKIQLHETGGPSAHGHR